MRDFIGGAGHSLTIIVIGIAVMVLKYNIAHSVFQFFEGVVGIMLVLIGLVRVAKIRFRQATLSSSPNNHRLAFGVGLVHGLAGSGVVVAMAVAQTPSVPVGVSYLLCFGVGGIVGMFGITFFLGKIIRLSGWEKWNINRLISLVSALFCLAYGIFVIVQNFVV